MILALSYGSAIRCKSLTLSLLYILILPLQAINNPNYLFL